MGGLKWISGPTVDAVSLEEIKTHCRIDQDTDDLYLEALAEAALRVVEQSYRVSILPTTWEVALDAAPATSELELFPYPLVSVTSIKSYDDDDVETTMSSTAYRVDTYSQPGRVVLKTSSGWPTSLRTPNAIVVRYVTGLCANAQAVPSDLKLGLLAIIAGLYERREPVSEVNSQKVQLLGGDLLATYRTMRLH